MKPDIKERSGSLWARISRITCVVTVVLLSSYCSGRGKHADTQSLTADETYLVDAYVHVAAASKLHAVNYLKSDSLFTVLDSTIDTTRIANTIRELNANPDRWLLVFKSIEQEQNPSREGKPSEEVR